MMDIAQPEPDLQGRRLWMLSRIPGIAGPAAFQRRLSEALVRYGGEVVYGSDAGRADALLVIGGTRDLATVRAAKAAGIPVFQRLNGMNWIHRRRWTGVRHFIKAELGNSLLRRMRRLADGVIYQSTFARDWWRRTYGADTGRVAVVHNGVPLDQFNRDESEAPASDPIRVLVIEGRLGGGYEIGLEWAVQLADGLEQALSQQVELQVAGMAERSVRQRYAERIAWLGVLPPERLPGLHRHAHFLFSADLHPACPNSVLEAMASGCPVVAFETGSIAELVPEGAGAVVPYGSDSWQLEPPDIAGLVQAAIKVIKNQASYRAAARAHAERSFGVDKMLHGYLAALDWA